MSAAETPAHQALKRHALRWAREQGLPLVATEVRIPRSAYRADAVAASAHPAGADGRVAVFECKQARADLLRDCADEPRLQHRTRELGTRLTELRALIAAHRPDLRRGESLFPEFDAFDFGGLRHETLAALEAELEAAQHKLLASVKFARLHRYNSADYLYLVTEPGMLAAHEVPVGWGWLERAEEALILRLPPSRHPTAPDLRLLWLERMAAAGARPILHELRRRPPAAR